MKTKVLCGGKFNIIHEGHRHFLKEAKKLGDELVVVVANDSHNKRAYAQSHNSRAEKIKEMNIADKVVIGDANTFVQTVIKEKPQIIALGYDQKLPKDVEEYVKENKIKIMRLEKYGNYETSKML